MNKKWVPRPERCDLGCDYCRHYGGDEYWCQADHSRGMSGKNIRAGKEVCVGSDFYWGHGYYDEKEWIEEQEYTLSLIENGYKFTREEIEEILHDCDIHDGAMVEPMRKKLIKAFVKNQYTKPIVVEMGLADQDIELEDVE